jgi:hypothetical protein
LGAASRTTREAFSSNGKARRAARLASLPPSQATATTPVATPPAPNRFKALLDTASNPPEFPPPEEPQGVIFPKDVPPAE